jgi:acyl-CoA synthetase (NDP forming)
MFEAALSGITSTREKARKPLLFSISGDKEATDEITKLLENKGFPVYPEVTRAIAAMAAMSEYYMLNRT